jgi:4-amino-4-deoxy-L-arabinose transferase-like glycosyltransferase
LSVQSVDTASPSATADRTDTTTPRPDSPSDDREFRFRLLLVSIALGALVARVAYVILVRDRGLFPDAVGYHFRGLLLADGHGFVFPVREVFGVGVDAQDATVPPGWTLLLAGAAKLGLRSVLSQQIVSCFVGAATVAMTGLAGRVAFGRRIGLVAAGIAAVYPNVWGYERDLVSEPLAMFGVATTIWLAYRFLARPSGWRCFALGCSIGILAMIRAEQITLFPLLFLALLFVSMRAIDWRRRIGWLAVACVGCALPIVPWAAYNSTRFDHPVPLSNSLGLTMRAGNCDATYSGEFLGYAPPDNRPDLYSKCGVAPGAAPAKDETDTDMQLRHAALNYMRAHRSRVPVVVAARIGRTFSIYRPAQQTHFEADRRSPIWVPWSGLVAYWLLVPFAIYGAVVARGRGIPIYPIALFFVVVVLAVAMTIGAVRYRATAEIPLVLLAAVGIDQFVRRRTLRVVR